MSGLLINGTIDDTELGDNWTQANVTYEGGWQARPDDCSNCKWKLDPTLLKDGTWHYARANLTDNQTPISFTLTFPGNAIYVYGVAFPKTIFEHNEFAVANLSFILDGHPSLPNYYAEPLATGSPFQYNTLVYSQTGLQNDSHVLQITLVNGLDSPRFNAFLFDYAVYMIETSPSSDSPTTSPLSTSDSGSRRGMGVGPIIGITLGALVPTGLVTSFLVFYFVRRRRRHGTTASGAVADFSSPPEYTFASTDSPPDLQPPLTLSQTTPLGISKQREASALRAQRSEARNAAYNVSHTTIPPAYEGSRR